MKILHVISGLDDGGAEAVLFQLCVYDKANHHVVVSMGGEGKYAAFLRSSGIRVYCLNMRRGVPSLKGGRTLWHLFRSHKPDIVQTWMYHADLFGGVIGRLAGMTRIYWGIHTVKLDPNKSGRLTILITQLNAVLSHWIPLAIICVSKQAPEVHKQLGYTSAKFLNIPNGYDLDKFQPNDASGHVLRTQWKICREILLIGVVARFDPLKDHANLFAALAIVKDKMPVFHCILIGRDMTADTAQLVKWVKKYNIQSNISLLGQRKDIPDVMNAIDLLVLSSCSEAFPNVINEAMACGTPCVTTNVGDAAFIVGDTGWVAPPENPDALAKAISDAFHAMQDQKGWHERKKNARKRVADNFSVTSMVEAYNKAWRKS